MNKLKEPIRKSEDEIDLRLVFSKIGDGFHNLGKRLQYIYRLTVNNIILILVFVLAGLGIGYLYFATQRPFYNSSMTLMLYKIRNEFVEDQLKKLSDMIDDGNYEAIAARLDITPEAAADIRRLQVMNLDEDKIEEDSILAGSPFRIDLSLYNNELFNTMEPALTEFLETNKYFSKQKQIKEIQTRKMISKLRNDIVSIDSVKEIVVAPKGPTTGLVYGEAVDPTNLYRESVNMYKEQVELESDLDRLSTVEVVTGFAPRLKPTGPKFELILIIGGLLGFIAGLIVANKLEKRRRGI